MKTIKVKITDAEYKKIAGKGKKSKKAKSKKAKSKKKKRSC